MKTVRIVAGLLFYLARALAVIIIAVLGYVLAVVLLYRSEASQSLPIEVNEDRHFQIFYPFSTKPFLLGDYTESYLVPNLLIIAFYGLFLWLLGDIFHAFKQPKLFTPKGTGQLSRFYILNLLVPFGFFTLLLLFGQDLSDMLRISLLHLVIGVFTFFMAAIFKQGQLLQEEQDLTL